MKYYILSFTTNYKEVGKFPQSIECLMGDVQKDFIPWERKIDFDFKLPEPILEKKSKQTSYINVVAIPSFFLVIDDDLLNFLRDFKIGNYQNWKINTWQDKQIIEKYNLFLLNDTKQVEYIDFKKSEFYSKNIDDWDNSGVQKTNYVENYNEYISLVEMLRKDKLMIYRSKITLNLRNAKEDLFRVVGVHPEGYFVSEKLKNSIENNGFTGMEFKEVSDLEDTTVTYN